jgi:LysM repeat protein
LHSNLIGMKKIVLCFCVFLFACATTLAQKKDLLVKSSDAGLYLDHKVAPKESFFAVGRLYNVSAKYLASYNELDVNKGLMIDQKLRIPLTDTNFVQSGNAGTPVYYKVEDKEGLMTVSNKNNKVSLASLRNWNALKGDELKKDTRVIVGFLKTSAMPAITIAGSPTQTEPVAEKPVVRTEVIPEAKTETEDKTKKDLEKEAEAELKAEKKENKKDPPPVVKETRKPVIEGAGYFQHHFEQQVRIAPISKNETVTSGIFKTTSGWQDAKYYLLIDKVAPGTIVKIINPTNNKAVFAKVLGEMSGIRQNDGLNIRISNAAASALEIAEQDKFIVKVNY